MSVSVENATAATARAAQWARGHYALLGGIALLQMVLRAELPLGQDMLWGARFGEDFLSTGHLARHDTYSWTAFGKQWVPNSWAWNVLLGLSYRIAHVVGLWLLGALLALTLAYAVGRTAQWIGASPLATAAIYVPLGYLGLIAVPRAQTVSTIAVLAICPLVRAIVGEDTRRAWRAVTITIAGQLIWMNLHSGALLTPVLIAACGGCLLLTQPRRPARTAATGRLVVATVATAAACLATPYGPRLIEHANDVRAASVGLIVEWDHVGVGNFSQVSALIIIVAALALAWHAWTSSRPDYAAGIVVLAAAAGFAIRFVPILAIIACPELCVVVSRLAIRPRMFKVMIGATCGLLGLIGVENARDLREVGVSVGQSLIARLPHGCRLLNDDLAGDGVVLFRQDVKVAIDGRNDLYGRKLIVRVVHLFQDKPGTDSVLDNDHVTCVLGPSDTALVKHLRHSPAWTVIAHDRLRTLLVRTAGSPR